MCSVLSTLSGAVKRDVLLQEILPNATHGTVAKSALPNAAAAKRSRRLGRESVQSCTLLQRRGTSTNVTPGSPWVLAQQIIITGRRPRGVPSALACPRRRLVCRAEPSRGSGAAHLCWQPVCPGNNIGSCISPVQLGERQEQFLSCMHN